MFTIEQVNELKKALHNCGNALGCEECPYNNVTCCQDKLNKDALTLILEYEDTIQQLEAETDKQYEQAKADILGNMSDGGTSCHWCIAQHKSEARKEFAEKLKEKSFVHYNRFEANEDRVVKLVTVKDVDNLVKEMESE